MLYFMPAVIPPPYQQLFSFHNKFNDFFFIHPKGLGTQLLYWLPKKLKRHPISTYKGIHWYEESQVNDKVAQQHIYLSAKTHLSKSKQWNTDVTQSK